MLLHRIRIKTENTDEKIKNIKRDKGNIGRNRSNCSVTSVLKKLIYILVYSDYLRREKRIRRPWI